jgi:hypothetical protein
MRRIKVYLVVFCSVATSVIYAQWGVLPGGDGRTAPYTIRSIGIGNFPLLDRPKADLHISDFYLPGSPFFFPGTLFRSDGNTNVNNNWQLFTGVSSNLVSEKFRLTALVNSSNISLNAVQNGYLQIQTGSIPRVHINGNSGPVTGFVGVNSNAPTRQLDVNGKIRAQDLLSNGADAGLVTYFADGTLQNIAFTGNANQVLLGNGTWGASAGGAVSLCNPNPSINNVVKVTGLNTLCGTNITDLAPLGFVGINNLVPNDALDVSNGNIDVETAVNSYKINNREFLWHKGDVSNVFLGVQAGLNHAFNSNAQNTIVGYRAGFTGSGISPINIQNVLIGYEAGFNNTGGSATYVGFQSGFSHGNSVTANTFIGYQTGFNTLGGSNDNTMVGFKAGFLNTSGDQNVFMGNTCGGGNTTGNYNSFYGTSCGAANASFNYNSCFGASSGVSAKGNENTFAGYNSATNGIGNYNVAIGSRVMQSAVIGDENTVIGYRANFSSAGTSFNTIIGSQSALGNLTGANNTFVGFSAAVAQTSGTNNVYMGFSTGTNMSSGSDNTYIGARADATNLNSNINNAAAIGSGALVTNSNHMILGNNFVNVGIGLSGDLIGPGNKLEIKRTNFSNPLSGLRLTDLAGAIPFPANNQVLSVDPINGDVILTIAPPAAVFGGTCGVNPPALPSSWEIPLGSFNYVFSGQGNGNSGISNVGIGTNCSPLAKLHVDQSSGSNNGSIGILVENNDLTPCFSSSEVIGLKSVINLNNSSNTVSGRYRIGGWFEVPNPNGCGIFNNYAIVVPQGGGKTSLGYTPPNFISGPGALLDVNGVTNSSGGYTQVSDVNLKNTIVTIPNALSKIKSLRPVTYKWNIVTDSLMNGTHSGFIAQEVDTVISHAVKTQSNGFKSIAYDEIIPYIVSAMQAQQKQLKTQDSLIQVLTQSITSCCSNSSARSSSNNTSQMNVDLTDKDIIVLNQNVPNPFAEQTTINYNIPEKYGYAQLVFKTVDGKIIKTVDVTKKGRGVVNVFANDLSYGLYMYSLIVDGEIIDTKKMIKQN